MNDNPEDKMGTTLSILLMAEKYYYSAYVGDGRIYIMRDSAAKDISKTDDLEYNNNFNLIAEDQSWVNLQVKQNKMTHEEAVNHKKSNLIYESLSVKVGVNPLYSFGTYAEGDKFILMTVGVYKNLSNDKIYNIIENEIGNDKKKSKKLKNLIHCSTRNEIKNRYNSIEQLIIDLETNRYDFKFKKYLVDQ